MSENAGEMVEHLFRRQSGRMVATLTRILGTRNLDLAEDVVQEALLKALQVWRFRGIPANPTAWLIETAKNRALDWLRRSGKWEGAAPENLAGWGTETMTDGGDEELTMMFLCCDPALPQESRVALTLKSVCGFSTSEIARAFLADERAIAQRIVRAKRQIRDEGIEFERPAPGRLAERLDAVLEVVYLMFNEGYAGHETETLVRADLCQEAVRLAREMARQFGTPRCCALAALTLLHGARLSARTDEAGELLRMEEQDRELWNHGMIAEGFAWLERSMSGNEMSDYHLEAGIAAAHCAGGETDWEHIVDLYTRLYERNPSPVIGLNRAVALAQLNGARSGLDELRILEGDPGLKGYYLLPAVQGRLWEDLGDVEKAAAYYRRALGLVSNGAERRFLERRLRSVG